MRSYQIYVTDAMRAAYKLNYRWADRFRPEETRTAEEITESIISGFNALAKGSDGEN